MAKAQSTKRSSTKRSSTKAPGITDTPNTNTTDTKERITMGLSSEEIADLLAGTRASKGAGTQVLQDFLDSELAGDEVDLTSGPLAGREPGKAYTALTNARKRTRTDDSGETVIASPQFQKIDIKKKNKGTKDNPDWHVYLLNMDLVSV